MNVTRQLYETRKDAQMEGTLVDRREGQAIVQDLAQVLLIVVGHPWVWVTTPNTLAESFPN